ncbi:MAG: glycosyltransferase family 4 protein [Candidatus Aminicenantes bacterium]|nr:MAG: glycosyltransferase family 4 protein [Candidatus Aminicenantes bacterium]
MNIKRNILYIIDNIEFGGGERVFSQIIRGLSKERYNISVAGNPGGILEEKLKKIDLKIEPVDMASRYNLGAISQIKKIIKAKNVHIVHSQGGRADFFARQAARSAKVPIIISSIAMLVEGYDVSTLKKGFYVFIDRWTEKKVDKFIILSEPLRQTLIEKHKIPPEKIVKIYNGIETEEYDPNIQGITNKKHKVRIELGLKNDIPVIGAIGRLVWQKGFEFLIQAIPNIIEFFPEAKFLIVGEGPLRKELEGLSERLRVKDNIIFAGFRSHIKEILASIDILAMPSLLEGLPLVLLEGMAMAKPIVATKIDGITEVLENGKTGLLVSPESTGELAEAIIEILTNKTKADLLGQNARRLAVEKFSVKKMVEQTEEVYKNLLREKKIFGKT